MSYTEQLKSFAANAFIKPNLSFDDALLGFKGEKAAVVFTAVVLIGKAGHCAYKNGLSLPKKVKETSYKTMTAVAAIFVAVAASRAHFGAETVDPILAKIALVSAFTSAVWISIKSVQCGVKKVIEMWNNA